LFLKCVGRIFRIEITVLKFAGRLIMGLLRTVCLTCALALASSQVLAFQEQQAGGAPAAKTPAPGIVIDNSGAPEGAGAGLNFGDAPPAARDVGTKVFVPGLGLLGVLPKMDFGLELLYGAAETQQQVTEPSDLRSLDDDDLKIRGTVKHRF
jgi:hypothetical protein